MLNKISAIITLSALFLIIPNIHADQEPEEVLIGNELRDIAMDDDYVWIATEKGVNRYDRKADEWKFFTVADGLISNQVNCVAPELVEGIFRRKSGDEVWFGTDSGVSVYYKETGTWKSYTTKDGLVHNKVNVISARGDDVWIGAEKGVSLYDKKKDSWNSYITFPGIPTSRITALYHQHAYAWIGTDEGLARYNYGKRKWEYFRNDGSLWYSPDDGERKAEDFPSVDNHVNSIDGEGSRVYITTNSSLIIFDSRTANDITSEQRGYSSLGRGNRIQEASRYRPFGRTGDRLGMAGNRRQMWEMMGWTHVDVVTLSADKQHEVSSSFHDVAYRSGQTWVATNRGLIRFDFMTGERQIFRKRHGMIDDEINSVATTGGEVWIGTPHGLSRYNSYRRSWKNYEIEKALPSSYVTALAEDKDGMWFATRNAVSSLRNDRWKTFTRNEGLAGDNIKSIAVVGNFVWFGTDEGISRLNKSTLTWDNFDARKTDLVSNNITSVLVDGKHIWVGTKEGLSRYDNTTGQWSLYNTRTGLLDIYINALIADPEYIWVGTRLGLNRYNKKLDKWEGFKREGDAGRNVITSLALNKDKVWVGTKKGLSSFDIRTGEWSDYTDKPLSSIAIQKDLSDYQTVIWLGGRRTIERYQPDSGGVKKFDDNDIEGISRVNVFRVQDTAKYVWFATDGGIFRYNKIDSTWWTYSPSKERGSMDILADGNVRSIASDADYVYFGTAGGISRFDKMTGNWVNFTKSDGMISDDVYALLIDEGYLWIGTREGISRYDTISDSWAEYTTGNGLPSNVVFSLAKEGNRIWAGTRGGAAYLDGDRWQKITTSNGLPDNQVWSVAVDDDGVLWFGTNKGVARYNPGNESWILYTIDDGLTDNIVLSIGFSGKYVFLNTPKGATIYDRQLDNFTPFSKMEGLAGIVAKCIGAEQDIRQKIWIGTDDGATHYDFVTDLTDNYYENDGLASNNVQTILVDKKDVWFGMDAGLSRYDMENDKWLTFRKAPTISQESSSADMISPNIKSLSMDGSYIWVGTRIGLTRYDTLSDQWEHFPMPNQISRTDESSLESPLTGFAPEFPPTLTPLVRAMAVNGKYVWLGTEQGILVYDSSAKGLVGFTSRLDNYDINNIRTIFVDDGDVLISTDKILCLFERFNRSSSWTFITDNELFERSYYYSAEGKVKSSEKRIFFDEAIGLLDLMSAKRRGDLIWFGKQKGLGIFNLKKRKADSKIIIPDDLSEKTITSIVFDEKQAWVGTRDGLYSYDFDSKTWENFDTEDGLASDRITTITVDEDYIWVGSSNRGVSYYDKSSRKWQIFNSENGLDDNNVRTIVAGERYIWFGTFSGGVSRYDKSADLWTNYRPAEYREMTYNPY